MIAILTILLLLILSLWMFIKASEDEEECYKCYRNNILGIAGDFCVFTEGDAKLSECTADIAIGGKFDGTSFGNYDTGWSQFYSSHLECVNLNSYIGGHYENGTYQWKGDKTKEQLTCHGSGIDICKGTYEGEHQYGQANLYINTCEESSNNVCTQGGNPNQCQINGKTYNNPQCNDDKCDQNGKYNAYNVKEVKCKFIDFEKEFEDLRKLSETLKNKGENGDTDCKVNCKNEPNNTHTIKYQIKEDESAVIITVEADNFFNSNFCDTFDIENLASNKKIIINVDCTDQFTQQCRSTPKIQINGQSGKWDALAENIIWNFYYPDNNGNNGTGAQLEVKEMIGTILAPNIEVKVTGNLYGAVIAKKILEANTINGINSSINWSDIGEEKPKEETTSVYVEKEWIDKDNAGGKRPDNVKFKLLADGVEKETITLRKQGQIVRINDKKQQGENEEKVKSIAYSTSGSRSIASVSETEDCCEYYIEIDKTSIQDWWKYNMKNLKLEIKYSGGKTETKEICANNFCNWGFDQSFKVKIPKGQSVTITFETTILTSDDGSHCYLESISTKQNTCGVEVNWPNNCNWIVVKLSTTECSCTPTVTISNDNLLGSGGSAGENNGESSSSGTDESNQGNQNGQDSQEGSGSGSTTNPTNPTNPGEGTGGTGSQTGGETDGDNDNSINPDNSEEQENPKEWSCIIKDLPKYQENGKNEDGEGKKEIVYTIKEVNVSENYISEIEKIDENEEDKDKYAAKYRIINTLLTDIEGEKIWDDENDNDGVRPESIEVTLYQKDESGEDKKVDVEEYKKKVNNTENQQSTGVEANGEGSEENNELNEKSKFKNPITVTKNLEDLEAEKDSNKWKFKFEGVKKYNKEGKEIKYTVKENTESEGLKDKYTATVEDMKITNKHKLETTEVTVTKVWDDNNDQDGYRPKEVKVTLLADGEEIKAEDSKSENEKVETTATLNKNSEWKHTFKNLPKYKNKKKIEYTVKEENVNKYTTTISDDNTITNKHEPEKISITVKKIWKDNDDQDGKRPENVTVKILENENELENKKVTLNAENNWEATIDDLPKFKEGKEIVYTVDEEKFDDYKKDVKKLEKKEDSEKAEDGKEVIAFEITNTHEPEKTKVSGKKTWDDKDNQDGIRPEKVAVKLLADGQPVADKEVEVSEKTEWKYEFKDVPKYKNKGTEIVYTVEEDAVEGYTAEVDSDNNITNKHKPVTIDIEGTKTWDDSDNQDGKRPKEITVRLFANDKEKETKVVKPDEDNNWKYKFTNLPKYEKGQVIKYTIKEDEVKDYDTTIDEYNITNKHTPETITVKGEKTWEDANNQDGKRPESITVYLVANGERVEGKVATASEKTEWEYEFKDVPKYSKGEKIKYTVEEEKIEGYTSKVDENNNITNTHKPEKIDITGTKKWEDSDNQDGKRPKEITVRLFADGKQVEGKEATASEKNNWEYKFKDVPKYRDQGVEIKYTVKEDAVDGYTSEVDKDNNITNKHTPETITVKGKKTWEDANNQDGIRPESITVYLKADGKRVEDKEAKASADTGWEYEFKDVPKYRDQGVEIKYTVEEDDITGYTSKVDKNNNITNTHKPETIDIKGTKKWEDADNQDGKRPNKITIKVFANDKELTDKKITVIADDKWEYEIKDLPKNEAGKPITYTVEEEPITGYKINVEGYDITNSHEPEKIDISGRKTWDDANDQDGKRPTQITVKLLANKEVKETRTVTAENNWSYEFKGVDKYANGKEIKYSIDEDKVDDYTLSTDGYNLKNTHKPETIVIEGTKKWDDAEDQDGKRPDKVVVKLSADGEQLETKEVTAESKWKYKFENLPKYKEGKIIEYKIDEEEVKDYTKEIKGYDIINHHEPEKTSISGTKTWNDNDDQDGKRPDSIRVKLFGDGEEVETRKVTKDKDWKYEFKDLPKYKKGVEIKYTIDEVDVKDYTKEVKDYDVTNTHTPEKTEVSVTKVWNDSDNQDGKRPEEVTVKLLADGKEFKTGTITAKDGWKYTFKDLDKYKKGQEIKYTIKEDEVKGYASKVDEESNTITNTHEPEKINIAGTKKWDDNNDQDGKRPEEVKIKLLADGVEVKTKKVTANDDWKYTFENVPKYSKGQEIKYTVDEEEVKDYTKTIDKYDITNKHIPEKTEVSGTKIWEDEDNQDGIRPEKIKVNLFKGEEKIASQEVTAKDEWKYTFKDLDKYSKGKEIKYTIKEEEVKGYTSKVDKDNNITNTHKPEVTSISGEKKWLDEKNQDGIRPKSIEVKLLDGENVVATKTVTADTEWKYTFENVPKFRQGKEIQYTVDEEDVPGYDKEIKGYNITNTHKIEKVSVSGTKTWVDDNNQDKVRPESITVRLYANGEEVKNKKVTKKDGWKYTFKDLAKYADGQEINYTINEDKVTGYEKTINGYDITNTHESKRTSVSGTKIWVDPGYENFRPNSVKINLLANGKAKDSKTVTEADDWKYEFTDLPKYEAGKEIVYTITEDEVEGYETTINDYNVINRYHAVAGEEVIDIDVEKEWEDAGYEAIRPSSVKVNLLANGKVVRTQEITAKNKWKFTFKQVELFDKNGDIIKYTITEDAVSGYETRIDGFKITNTYVPMAVADKVMIKINKYEKGTTKKLKDAKFELVIKKEDGVDKDKNKKYKEVLKKTNTTNSIGQIILKDLDLEAGTYLLELTEKEAPKGYKKSDDSIKVEFTVKEQDGKKVIKLKEKYKNAEVEKTVLTVKVENTKEQHKDNTTSKGKLPQTGPGKTIVVGAVVMVFLAVGAIGVFKYREVKF